MHHVSSRDINANARPDPILQPTEESESQLYRYVNIAIPYLNMYKPTAMIVTVGLGASKTWVSISAIIGHAKARDWTQCGSEAVKGSFTVILVVGSIIYPTVGAIASNATQLVIDVYTIGNALLHKDFQTAGMAALSSVHTIVYLGSMIYATPQLIIISLLSQATFEIYKAAKEFNNDRKLESLALLGLAAIRIYQATPHIERLHRNKYGAKVDDSLLAELKKEIEVRRKNSPGSVVDIEAILVDMYVSNNLTGTSFDAENLQDCYFANLNLERSSFKGAKITNTSFANCQMEGANLCDAVFKNTIFSHCTLTGTMWDDAKLTNVRVIDCNFSRATSYRGEIEDMSRNHPEWAINLEYYAPVESSFINISVTDSSFANCSFNEAFLYRSDFKNTQFAQCTMEKTSWNYSTFDNVTWIKCDISKTALNDTHMNSVLFERCKLFETNFLGVEAKTSKMIDSDLTDCLIFDAKKDFKINGGSPQKFTRPVVGMLWSFEGSGEYASRAHEEFQKKFNALILKMDYTLDDMDEEVLQKEVDNTLKVIQAKPEKYQSLSTAQAILHVSKGKPLFDKIQKKSEEAVGAMDALWIPGGADINSKYYGKPYEVSEDPYGFLSSDRRTLVELNMIEQARKQNVFTMGICRGAQILNVEAGGTLVNDIPGHSGVEHELELKEGSSPPFEFFKSIMNGDKSMKVLSMHHQGCDKIGKHFVKVFEHDGATEAIVRMNEEGEIGAIGLQFHPEAYSNFEGNDAAKNKNIISYFVGRATESWSKKNEAATVKPVIAP